MPHAIVVCCDGTGNTFGRADTNVRRVFDALDDKRYFRYYDTGLGTDKGETTLGKLSKSLTNFGGAALAVGQHRKVLNAYRFLCRYYQPGAKIFMFGFSRGAWCIRRLAKMVAVVGLLPEGLDHLIPQAYNAYEAFKDLEEHEKRKIVESYGARKAEYDSFCALNTLRHAEFIFVGAWDTVRSAGGRRDPKNCAMHCSLHTQLVGRHALALDERRRAYEPELWDDDPRVKQRWFPGDHSDIGGGNLGRPASPSSDDALVQADTDLSYLSLLWMCREANRHGLEMNLAPISNHEAIVRANVWRRRKGVSDKSTRRVLSSNSGITAENSKRKFTDNQDISCDEPAFEARLAMMSNEDRDLYRATKCFDVWDRKKGSLSSDEAQSKERAR